MPNVLASRLSREHAQDLLRLERAELLKMRGLYDEARIELLGRLSALGASAKADTFTAQHLRGALAQVQSGVAAMTAKLAGAHGPAIVEASKDAALQTLDEIAFFERTRDFRGGAFGRIQTSALRSVMAHEGLLLSRFQSSIDAYGGQVIGEIQRRLGLHLVQRSTWQQMATDVAGRLYAHGVKGSQWKAERIVRSELIHGLNVGHQESLAFIQENHLPDLAKQWDATLDERTCPVCVGLNGQVRKVGETWSHAGRVIPHPPAHPNCRCRLLPYRKQWAELAEDDGEPSGPSPVKVQVSHDAAKARVVVQGGGSVPAATLAEVKAAKDAYRKVLLETPGEAAALEGAALVLRQKLVGFHKQKHAGQALSLAVSDELEKTLAAAQAALTKARAGAAKDLEFLRKSLADAYEKAGGSFPEANLASLSTNARHLARLEGKSGDALEAAVAEVLEDAKAQAVARYEGRVAAAAQKVSAANEALVEAVTDGLDYGAAEAALAKAAESQGRLLGLKAEDFKAHVAKVVSTAKTKAADAVTMQVVEARGDSIQALVAGGDAQAALSTLSAKSKLYHRLKNGLDGDDLSKAVAKDVAGALDAANAQIKAAAVAAEVEAAKAPFVQIYEADQGLKLKGALALSKLKHFDDVAMQLGVDAQALRKSIRDVLDLETESLIQEQAQVGLKLVAGKATPAEHSALLARLKEVTEARHGAGNEAAVAELMQSAKDEFGVLMQQWADARMALAAKDQQHLVQWILAKEFDELDGFAESTDAYAAALKAVRDIEGPDPFTAAKPTSEFMGEADEWIKAAKGVWDPEQVEWAVKSQVQWLADPAKATTEQLFASKILAFAPPSLEAVTTAPGVMVGKALEALKAKGGAIPTDAIAKLKAKFKPAPPNLAPPAPAAAAKAAAEVVDETPWPATQSGAPKQVVLPDGSIAKQVAGSSGSNPGGFYQVAGGETYFVKFPKSVGQVGAEKVSADLASMMGLTKKDYLAFKVGDKHVAIASPKITFKEPGAAKLKGWADQDELARHFVHAAWTRNWDVVGLGYDNLVEQGGKLLGVDYGGSLLWRAQGALKGDGMPAAVAELASLRSAATNQQTAAVFGHLTDQKLAETIKATISQLDDDAIKQVVATGKFTAADRAVIEKGLLARKAWLDEWADGVLGKQTPEQVSKALLGKLPNDPDAALVMKAGGGGGASADTLRKAYREAIAGDVTQQAKIGRRLWGGTPQLEANQDAGARFLIAAWKQSPDVVRSELQGSAWAEAMKPVLDVLEQHGAKLATPEQLFQKLKAAEEAAKKAAAAAAELAKKKAAEAAAKAAAFKAQHAELMAAYKVEKAAFDEQLAAWSKKVDAFLGDPAKRRTKTGLLTKAYEKKLAGVEARLLKGTGEASEKALGQKATLATKVAQHAEAMQRVAEFEQRAATVTGWQQRGLLRDAARLKRKANRDLAQAKATWARELEQLLPESGLVPPRPVPPKPPPGLGGVARPERFHVNANPTADPNAGHPTWQARRAELEQIASEIGMAPAEAAREIARIESAIQEWKGSARGIRKAQQLRFAGKTDDEILATGVSSRSLEHAKAMDGPLWARAAGHDGDIWRGENWAADSTRTAEQNREWLKSFLAENVGGEWTWPYSSGWATNNGFQGKGYGGHMPIQYHLVGRSSARSFKNFAGYSEERELQTRAGSKFRILSYEWFDRKNGYGHEVHINLVEVFEDGTTGLD